MSADIKDHTGNPKSPEAAPRRRTYRRLALFPVVLLLLIGTLWATAALYFDVRVSWLRLPLAAVYLMAVMAGWILIWNDLQVHRPDGLQDRRRASLPPGPVIKIPAPLPQGAG